MISMYHASRLPGARQLSGLAGGRARGLTGRLTYSSSMCINNRLANTLICTTMLIRKG